jgi:hypothetical protein
VECSDYLLNRGRLLLPQFVTRVATHGRLVLFVAVDAPLHLQRLLNTYEFLRGDITVTTQALDLRGGVRAVVEEDKVRQLMDELQRDLPITEVQVTALTLRQSRKARPIRPLRVLVAECALQFQRRMLLMIQWPVLALTPQTQGKENASNESE